MTDEAKSMARSMSSGAAMNKHSAVSLGRSTTQLAIGGTTTDGLRQDDIGHRLGCVMPRESAARHLPPSSRRASSGS